MTSGDLRSAGSIGKCRISARLFEGRRRKTKTTRRTHWQTKWFYSGNLIKFTITSQPPPEAHSGHNCFQLLILLITHPSTRGERLISKCWALTVSTPANRCQCRTITPQIPRHVAICSSWSVGGGGVEGYLWDGHNSSGRPCLVSGHFDETRRR